VTVGDVAACDGHGRLGTSRAITDIRPLSEEWLGSRVVSVLDSGAEGPGFKSQ